MLSIYLLSIINVATSSSQFLNHVLGTSSKSALKTWFKNCPDDDSESKHVASFINDDKLVVSLRNLLLNIYVKTHMYGSN